MNVVLEYLSRPKSKQQEMMVFTMPHVTENGIKLTALQTGEPPRTPDAAKLDDFLDAGKAKLFTAHWHGPELVFAPPAGVVLRIRAQTTGDVERLESVVPHDQAKMFTTRRVGDDFIFEPAVLNVGGVAAPPVEMDEATKLGNMDEKDLQVEAAKIGVEWSKSASKATMVKRIADARKKAQELVAV